MADQQIPHLGILEVALSPFVDCPFPANPARSLRAAIMRRLELLAPDISQALHDEPAGAAAMDRPWALSRLLGPMGRQGELLVARAGQQYRVRIAALTPPMLEALNTAFLSDHPLAQVPLRLEGVSFPINQEASKWQKVTTYPELLDRSHPWQSMPIALHSPTAFRQGEHRTTTPQPQLWVTGWLRRWNAFANVGLPEEAVLEYVDTHVRVERLDLRTTQVHLGSYSITGMVGEVEWKADGSSPYLLRLVNTLIDYAAYCGTGLQTSQGMGQTGRVMPGRRVGEREAGRAAEVTGEGVGDG